MPYVNLETNQNIENREEVMSGLSSLISRELGKPEKYIMVSLDKKALFFAGSETPAAFVEVKSIGFPGDDLSGVSAALCSFLEEKTGIPSEHIYIVFEDVPRSRWGWDGSTF